MSQPWSHSTRLFSHRFGLWHAGTVHCVELVARWGPWRYVRPAPSPFSPQRSPAGSGRGPWQILGEGDAATVCFNGALQQCRSAGSRSVQRVGQSPDPAGILHFEHWSRHLLPSDGCALTGRENPCQRGSELGWRVPWSPARFKAHDVVVRSRWAHSLFRRSGRGLGDLTDRAALVTGASGGLGATIARRLHDEGAPLVLSGRREGELAALAAELGREDTGRDRRPGPARGGERLAGQAGRVDILVANAGLPANGDLVDLEVEDIARAVDINVRSTLVLTRMLVPGMLRLGAGHVVIIGSLAGLAARRDPRSTTPASSHCADSGMPCTRSCAGQGSASR